MYFWCGMMWLCMHTNFCLSVGWNSSFLYSIFTIDLLAIFFCDICSFGDIFQHCDYFCCDHVEWKNRNERISHGTDDISILIDNWLIFMLHHTHTYTFTRTERFQCRWRSPAYTIDEEKHKLQMLGVCAPGFTIASFVRINAYRFACAMPLSCAWCPLIWNAAFVYLAPIDLREKKFAFASLALFRPCILDAH